VKTYTSVIDGMISTYGCLLYVCVCVCGCVREYVRRARLRNANCVLAGMARCAVLETLRQWLNNKETRYKHKDMKFPIQYVYITV
jgi:hypothetical protein